MTLPSLGPQRRRLVGRRGQVLDDRAVVGRGALYRAAPGTPGGGIGRGVPPPGRAVKQSDHLLILLSTAACPPPGRRPTPPATAPSHVLPVAEVTPAGALRRSTRATRSGRWDRSLWALRSECLVTDVQGAGSDGLESMRPAWDDDVRPAVAPRTSPPSCCIDCGRRGSAERRRPTGTPTNSDPVAGATRPCLLRYAPLLRVGEQGLVPPVPGAGPDAARCDCHRPRLDDVVVEPSIRWL